jgi:hypothetical protein
MRPELGSLSRKASSRNGLLGTPSTGAISQASGRIKQSFSRTITHILALPEQDWARVECISVAPLCLYSSSECGLKSANLFSAELAFLGVLVLIDVLVC